MQRLNAQDSLLVYGEATGWRLHLASLQVYDAAGAPAGLDLERVRDLYRRRLPHVPAFRKRLLRVPGGLGRPVWVEDRDIDVDAHVHGVRLPAPGTDHQLAEQVGELFAGAFDLTAPLWDVWVIEGLDGGRVAVLARMHHAAVDGVRGMEVQAATFDLAPDAPLTRPGEVPGPGVDAPGPLVLLAGAAARTVRAPVRLVRTGRHLARAAVLLPGVVRRVGIADLALPMRTSRLPVNRAVSPRRGFVFCSLPLAPAKAAAHQAQVTVNDVVLALMGGALRRYLGDRGELPERPLVAAVPADVSGGPTSAPGGNHWAVMATSLATDTGDPDERLRRVARSTRAAKAVQHAVGPDLWQELVDLPPAVIGVVARGYARLGIVRVHPPLVNLVVSDLRGPTFPLYLAGARLLADYPVGPVADGLGLNVTVISYQGSLDVGLSFCPDLLEDPWRLVDALRAESDDLARRYRPSDPEAGSFGP